MQQPSIPFCRSATGLPRCKSQRCLNGWQPLWIYGFQRLMSRQLSRLLLTPLSIPKFHLPEVCVRRGREQGVSYRHFQHPTHIHTLVLRMFCSSYFSSQFTNMNHKQQLAVATQNPVSVGSACHQQSGTVRPCQEGRAQSWKADS